MRTRANRTYSEVGLIMGITMPRAMKALHHFAHSDVELDMVPNLNSPA